MDEDVDEEWITLGSFVVQAALVAVLDLGELLDPPLELLAGGLGALPISRIRSVAAQRFIGR